MIAVVVFAAAELGYMAGADRIEGCLFGNGGPPAVSIELPWHEPYTQGIDPEINFSIWTRSKSLRVYRSDEGS